MLLSKIKDCLVLIERIYYNYYYCDSSQIALMYINGIMRPLDYPAASFQTA